MFLPGDSQGRGSRCAAVYGVAQSPTQLKRLSSSCSSNMFAPIVFSETSSQLCPVWAGWDWLEQWTLPLACASVLSVTFDIRGPGAPPWKHGGTTSSGRAGQEEACSLVMFAQNDDDHTFSLFPLTFPQALHTLQLYPVIIPIPSPSLLERWVWDQFFHLLSWLQCE